MGSFPALDIAADCMRPTRSAARVRLPPSAISTKLRSRSIPLYGRSADVS
jgi:hypothetical protein